MDKFTLQEIVVKADLLFAAHVKAAGKFSSEAEDNKQQKKTVGK